MTKNYEFDNGLARARGGAYANFNTTAAAPSNAARGPTTAGSGSQGAWMSLAMAAWPSQVQHRSAAKRPMPRPIKRIGHSPSNSLDGDCVALRRRRQLA